MGGFSVSAFRFVTSVLIGPWRASRGEAITDAVQARQAVRHLRLPDGLEWRVPGRIEQTDGLDLRRATHAH